MFISISYESDSGEVRFTVDGLKPGDTMEQIAEIMTQHIVPEIFTFWEKATIRNKSTAQVVKYHPIQTND